MSIRDQFCTVDVNKRIECAIKCLRNPEILTPLLPLNLNHSGAISHVGFIVESVVNDIMMQHSFTQVSCSQSEIITLELNVPVTVYRYTNNQQHTIEVFLPDASPVIVKKWIESGVALHFAIDSKSLILTEPNWKVPKFMRKLVENNTSLTSVYFDNEKTNLRIELTKESK